LTPERVDERYIRMALRWARRGAGRTSPNPLVGAVLVRNGNVIATGYHRRAGEDHAEIVALKKAGRRARGATLYLNLEPCDHVGKTPPCTRSLIQAGIKRVVAGMVDPNPLVAGKGIRRLRRAGITVKVGVLTAECQSLNEAFVSYIARRRPFVIVKLAASLDGKIATATGHSQWITGKEARRFVHDMRNQVDAIMVGVETVIADNPRLTCRIPGGRDPWRVVVDPHLRISSTARLLRQSGPTKTIIVAGSAASFRKVSQLKQYGAEVWLFPLTTGAVPLGSVLTRLARMGVMSVMIEGGAITVGKALAQRVVDKIHFFYAPKIIGGDGKSMVAPLGIRRLTSALTVKRPQIMKIGQDFLLSAYL
jgi:diaminohydroxyphosphoribosylaminopyrimidine deaminase / 5-amino-6-(5-phosphoribosylamino)uracil reductase